MQLQKLRGRDRLRLASRRMRIKENLIFLMGTPQLLSRYSLASMEAEHTHISAPNIRSDLWEANLPFMEGNPTDQFPLPGWMYVNQRNRSQKAPKSFHFLFFSAKWKLMCLSSPLEDAQVFPHGRLFSYRPGGLATHTCALCPVPTHKHTHEPQRK